ncbi:MAG: adenosine deaminase [Spirochaetia bacterium]|nr:adenosine deaminase [Spirochaetia bacterium]
MKNFDKNCLIDLHLHLDGSISIESARVLAKMAKVDIPASDRELKTLMSAPADCRNLNEYLRCFDFPLLLLQTRETISESVFRLLEELKAQGYIYAEIRFAPQLHLQHGLSQDDVVRAAISGLKRSSLKSQLILCCMAHDTEEKYNMDTVNTAAKYIGDGVAAVDMAGAEALFPLKIHTRVLRHAASLNIPFTLHAGEALGPENIKTALELGARRIGHGVRAQEDPALVKYLADHHIPLEMCPTSNLQTKAVDRIENYPLKKYLEAGIPVTVNTDNLAVSDTTLRNELNLLINTFGFDDSTVKQLLKNSAGASFLTPAEKQELCNIIESEF